MAIGRPVEGGSNADLAAVIRAKVANGLLPYSKPPKLWVGPGTDQVCDGCDLPIISDQREYEFDPPGWRPIRLHADCLALWQAATDARERQPSATADTTATHIAAILRDGFPSGYCIGCLAARLELSVPEVRDAAQILVARPGFRVVARVCYTCGRVRDDVVAGTPQRV